VLKNFLLAIIFMGLTMYLGYELYERSQGFDWNSSDEAAESVESVEAAEATEAPQRSLPDEIQIARTDGTSLEIRLTARNATHIQFERLSDGQAFTFGIAALDAASKKRVLEYPETGLSVADAPLRSGELTLESAHIEQLREAINRIDIKLRDMELEHTASKSKTERRTLKRQAEDLYVERSALEADIAQRSGN
jgi:hypothetical protein